MLLPKIKPDPTRVDPALDRLAGTLPGGLQAVSMGLPPCNRACPAGINVKGYIDLIQRGRYEESLRLIRKDNPMAGVSGFICLRPCERECTFTGSGQPMAIRDLKRFVAEFELGSGGPHADRLPPPGGPKVAVIGAGPTGLTAACDLAGYDLSPVIYEAAPEPGGLLRLCQPEFKLPRRVLDADIAYVKSRGVEIRTGVKLGKEITVDGLLKEGYKAVLLATGTGKGLKTGLPGEKDTKGIFDAITFFKKFRGKALPAKMQVAAVVLGGGPAALGTARYLARKGVKKVTVLYRLSKKDMPADPEETSLALEEGVTLLEGCAPRSFQRRSGWVTAVVCEQCTFTPAPDAGRTIATPTGKRTTVQASLVIAAEDRTVPPGLARIAPGLSLTPFGTAQVEPSTLVTAREGLFAAGNLVTGPRSLIEAVASGRRAAWGIASFLGLAGTTQAPFPEANPLRYRIRGGSARTQRGDRARWAGTGSEAQAGSGLNETLALKEAARCLRCGHCSACTVCSVRCEHQYYLVGEGEQEMLIRASREHEETLEKAGAVSLRCRVNTDWCIGCGRCEEACPHRAANVRLIKGEGTVSVIDPAACRACWCCVAACPTGAIARPCALPGATRPGRLSEPEKTSEAL